MATTPFALPRQTRETTILTGNGTVGPYGPTLFKVFDVDDVRVYQRPAGADAWQDVTGLVAITKTSGQPFDTFSVTFPAVVENATQLIFRSERVAERSLAVTRAGTVDSAQLEKELSKQATVQQEHRRDIDRAFKADYGQAGGRVATLPAGHFWKADADGNMVNGGSAADIAGAQGYAAQSAADRVQTGLDRAAAEGARDDTEAALAAAANAPQWSFANKAALALFAPAGPPATVTIDGQLYDYAAAGAPGHDGYAQDNANRYYVLRRSSIVELEAFRDNLDLDGPGDSSVGIAKALAMLGVQGGGKLIFPRQAVMRAKITNVPDNVEIDFNRSKLIAPNLTDTIIVSAQGSTSASTYSLFTGAAQLDQKIQVSGPVDFVVGDYIWIYDASARLSDGAVDINNEIRRVEGLSVAGALITVTLDMPLSFKKSAVAGGRRNVVKINFGKGRRLINLDTAAPEGSTGGATGVFARWLADSEIWHRRHTRGVGDANSIRACLRVNGGDAHSTDVQSAGHYHTGFVQGSRDCVWVGGYDYGVRHSVDMDSTDLCKVTGWVSDSSVSSPAAMAHNGAGGYGNHIEIEVRNGPDSSGGWGFFGTRGWNAVTGQGADESAYPILSPTVIVRGWQSRGAGSANFGVYFQQPARDMRVDCDIVNGDANSHDPAAGVTAAVRLYQAGNSGDIRIRKARGYAAALGIFSVGLSTNKKDIVNVEIDDVDYAKYGLYLSNSPGANLKRLVSGPNISVKLLHIDNGAAQPLRHLSIGDLRSSAPADKTLEMSGAGLGNVTGWIGSIDTPATIFTQTVAADFTLTREDIFNMGRLPRRIDGTAAANITAIEPGLFVGQRIGLWSGTSGTFPVTLKTTTANVAVAADRVLAVYPLYLTWIGGFWREDKA